LNSKRKLSELECGEKGVIDSFTDEEMSLKLMEMGCLPGDEVMMVFKAPFGDPVCIRISGSGYSLSLRLQEASTVNLRH
jgi:ferrous iron transport protein A